MTRIIVGTVAALLVTAAVTAGQTATLDEAAIAAAIRVGTKAKGKEQGLVMKDSAQSFAAALGSGGTGSTASSGFSAVIYSPTTWVRKLASDAAKRYQQLKAEDVTDISQERVLRIIANPDMPNTVTAEGIRGTSSVDHVVLQDKDRKITVQPSWKESFDTEAANAMGGKAAFKGLTVKFPLDSVRELRGPKADKEFFVVVIGTSGEEKRFEIKKKHFDDIP